METMDQPSDNELVGAMGLALAVIASLIERDAPIPKGEVGRCLSLIAQASGTSASAQREILESWARLLSVSRANDH
jgi:hypothetical protein